MITNPSKTREKQIIALLRERQKLLKQPLSVTTRGWKRDLAPTEAFFEELSSFDQVAFLALISEINNPQFSKSRTEWPETYTFKPLPCEKANELFELYPIFKYLQSYITLQLTKTKLGAVYYNPIKGKDFFYIFTYTVTKSQFTRPVIDPRLIEIEKELKQLNFAKKSKHQHNIKPLLTPLDYED